MEDLDDVDLAEGDPLEREVLESGILDVFLEAAIL
jgi:hypothetical protein